MKQGWKKISFEDSIVKVKYTTKIPSNDYLKQGLYPIVSQEEGLISGYWDNANDVFKVSTPVVIFGDHTRILKYVDFDFVLGADGVKILQPIKSIDAKFFKLYLESCKIPSLGYSRHYKLLKELQVPIPPREEQERIVEELDCLSGVIDKKREQLKQLDVLAQSIFYQMFGDPITNEKGWEVKKLKEVARIIGGYAFKSDGFSNEGIPVLKIGNINTGKLKVSPIVYYGEDERLLRYMVYPNDLVISLTGTAGKDDYGNVCILDNTYPRYYLNQRNAKIDLSEHILTGYMQYMLKNPQIKSQLTGISRGVRQGNISNKDLEELDIQLPPLRLQQEFADKIEAIEKQKELIKKSISETENLFNARMDYYFN